MPWMTYVRTTSNVLSDEAVAGGARQVGERLATDDAEADLFGTIVVNARKTLAGLPDGPYEVFLTNDEPIIRPWVETSPDRAVEAVVAAVVIDANDKATAAAEAEAANVDGG